MRDGTALLKLRGGRLNLQQSLIKSLSIDTRLIDCSDSRRKRQSSRVFIDSAEAAWAEIWPEMIAGKINFLTWLRRLLACAREDRLWFPPIFLKRLKEIERGELVLYKAGEPLAVDLLEGLPDSVRECCTFLHWKPPLVPNLTGDGYDSLHSRTLLFDDHSGTKAVEVLCSVWDRRPRDISTLRTWLVREIRQRLPMGFWPPETEQSHDGGAM